MPNKLTLEIDTSGIQQKFQDLPDVVSKQLVGKILKQAIEPTKKLARYYAPVHTGRMAAGIKVKAGRSSKTRVTVLVQAGNPGHLAEEGFTTRAGRRVEGAHFLERAFRETEQEMAQEVQELLQDGINQYFSK